MKRLHNPQDAAQWLRTQVRGVLHTDSRRVGAGDGFIAWPGGVTDGRQFVASAVKQGATACVVEHAGAENFAWGESDAIATYDGLKAASGLIAAAYYEQPSLALDVVAVTGTNGKTSTAWWLAHALQNAGKRCAMVNPCRRWNEASSPAKQAGLAAGLAKPETKMTITNIKNNHK